MDEFLRAAYEPILKLNYKDPLLTIWTYTFIVFVGLAIGSFLNVCIYRIPRGESLTKKASHCVSCGAKIRIIDIIPVISWICLRGRCHSCKEKISPRYPIVESLNCIIYIITCSVLDVNPKSIIYCICFSALIVIGFMDWDTQEIALNLLIFVGALAIPAYFLDANLDYFNQYYAFEPSITLIDRIIGAICISGAFFIIGEISGYLVMKRNGTDEKIRGIELGDTVLMFAAGLLFGYKIIIIAALLGIFLAAIGGIIIKLITKESKFAFGPYLAMGIFIGALWGEKIFNWYFDSFLTFTEY